MAIHDPEDPISPKVQRKMWRRVWIGLAIFVFVTPVLLWVAIDQSGKREWKYIQAELQAKGEATTIAELDLPSGEEIPDAENFGSVEWLRANKDGTESAALIELGDRMMVFSAYQSEREVLTWAEGNAFIGLASEPKARATVFDDAARSLEIDIPQSEQKDAVSRISAYLDLHDDIWEDLLEAADRPHAKAIPSFSERLAMADLPMLVSTPVMMRLTNLSKALKWRALVALHRGDTETFLRCFEISARLLEMASGEKSLIGVLVAITNYRVIQPALVEALWDEAFVAALGESGLKRLQASQRKISPQTILEAGLRSELVLNAETLQRIPSLHDLASENLIGAGIQGAAVRFAPKGWFLSSAAYQAELIDRHLFEAFRNKDHMGEMIAATGRMVDEVRSLNSLQRFNYFFVYLSIPAYSKIPTKTAYEEVRHRQAIIVCAVNRYRLKNGGTFPESLNKLVPTYLDSVPQDPMDGAPMRYTLTDEPGGFRLWSIGFDGIDDEGDLNLPVDEPESIRLDRDTYIGDWPWPTAAKQFPRPDSESE
jgi:hypothetical protein